VPGGELLLDGAFEAREAAGKTERERIVVARAVHLRGEREQSAGAMKPNGSLPAASSTPASSSFLSAAPTARSD